MTIWGLLCQFKGTDFSYYAAGNIGTPPEAALHDAYLIFPDGAPVDPIARERVQQHMALHWQYLKQTNPTAGKQLAQKIDGIEKGAAQGQQQPPRA